MSLRAPFSGFTGTGMSANNGICVPSINGGIFNYPWGALARHCSALFFYGMAFAQWPGNTVASTWPGEHRIFGYNMGSLMFTLCFWSACLYHYAVSAGRVEIMLSTGMVRARGWVVRSSRKAHRIILSLTLAISALTMAHATTMDMVFKHYHLDKKKPTSEQEDSLFLLKIDQTISFIFFLYILGRLVFEPIGIQKKPATSVKITEKKNNNDDCEKLCPNVPLTPEECSICVSKWANRQLGCGHQICCCCLVEIFKSTIDVSRCPFCRSNIEKVRKIYVCDGGDVEIMECCQSDPNQNLREDVEEV